MERVAIDFGVRIVPNRDFGGYPALQDLEARVEGQPPIELGYSFRDYGMLSLSLIKRFEENNTIKFAPQESVNAIKDSQKLAELVGSVTRSAGKYTEWMIDKQCPDVGITDRRLDRGKMTTFPGPVGILFMKAARSSTNPAQSLEDLIILKVLAKRIANFGLVLRTLQADQAIHCVCGKTVGQELHALKGKTTKLSSKELCVTIYDAYLVNCETPEFTPSAVSSDNPMAISSTIYNEFYRVYHGLRVCLQNWLNDSLRASEALTLADPYETSDRMPREITRALERVGLLHSLYDKRYVSTTDRLLSDLVNWFRETILMRESAKGTEMPKEIPLSLFTDMVKKEFRILLDPNEVMNFLRESVEHKKLGIDLEIARGYLVSDYTSFTERLENLGLATIRPDGDVMIKIA